MILTHVKKARKPIVQDGKTIVEVGQEYWWIKANPRSAKSIYTSEPTIEQKRQHMTEWEARIGEFEDKKAILENFEGDASDFETEKDSLVDEINEFKEELEGRLESMPESLKDGSVLNERIDELESMVEEVSGIEPPKSDD